MGTGNLTDRSSGQTILEEFFNSIHDAMEGDFVGRNTSGVPTSGQNLGTAAIPWGTIRANGVVIGGSSLDASQIAAPPFRVVSGGTRSTSNQPAFLDPAGSGNGASFTLLATATPFVYDVNGVTNTISADIAKGSLTTAPSSNNTCLVNDADAADQAQTRLWGEAFNRKNITIDTIGSEISSLDGQVAAFKINDGSNDEYFLALVDTTNNQLRDCYRGFFYDDSLAPINRIAFANNDTITLMSLGWVFVDDDGSTVDVTYTEPVWSTSAPSSPATGDYWYDMGNALWKRYDGATFQTVDRVFAGWVVIDDTDCVAARSVEFDARYKPDNGITLELSTTEIVRSDQRNQKVNVAGNELYFGDYKPLWNITTDLADSSDMYDATEQASRTYHLYLTDEGEEVISDIQPYWRPDLYGWYHPHNPWRKVGVSRNDGSSDLVAVSDFVSSNNQTFVYDQNGGGSTNTRTPRWSTIESQSADVVYTDSATDGGSFEVEEPGLYSVNHMVEYVQTSLFFGITVSESAADLAASLFNTSRAVVLATSNTDSGSGNIPKKTGETRFFKIGDVIRGKNQSAISGLTDGSSPDFQRMVIQKVRGVEQGV